MSSTIVLSLVAHFLKGLFRLFKLILPQAELPSAFFLSASVQGSGGVSIPHLEKLNYTL